MEGTTTESFVWIHKREGWQPADYKSQLRFWCLLETSFGSAL